jgi:UDP-N-acetylmuramoyl-L-alanyl-D-glutamate--2,6-diaminopimelate ligase
MPTTQLSRLIEAIDGVRVGGEGDPIISKVTSDSRQTGEGCVFVAVKGEKNDGHDYVSAACHLGASAVVIEQTRARSEWFSHSVVVETRDTRLALAQLSALLCGPLRDPLARQIVGITGTNGKTTCTYLLESIISHWGEKPGVIGTVNYRLGDLVLPAPLTTPSPELLWQTMLRLQQAGATHLLMEVSSHALHQHRVDGIPFRVAGFTNLTQDHLDYHGSMEQYLQDKSRLFSDLVSTSGRAVLPAGDAAASYIQQRCLAPVWTYSADPAQPADIYTAVRHIGWDGIKASLHTPAGNISLETKLLGEFNLRNLALVCGIALALDIPISAIEKGLSAISNIPGRMERIISPMGFQVLIDYAHTPDALTQTLKSLRSICQGRLIVVFGCGGDRDQSKRRLMGEAVGANADICIITSDNPRTEDPQTIVEQIAEGTRLHLEALPQDLSIEQNSVGYLICLDRRMAINQAINYAQADDIVLIAGKGHEDYQIIGYTRYPFSDRMVVTQILGI